MWTAGEIYRTVDHISVNKKFFFQGKKEMEVESIYKNKINRNKT